MKGYIHKDLNIKHLKKKLLFDLPIDRMINLKSIGLCGNFGDPLMHPELDEIIDFFKRKNKEISISTNASLRNLIWWELLGQKKNIKVKFCIDGIGATHQLYRRNTSYEKIIENAKSFINSGGDATWQFIIFKHNEHQIEQAKKLAYEIGFKHIFFVYSDRFDTNNKWQVFDEGDYIHDLEVTTGQITLREKTNTPVGEKWWKNLFKVRSREPIKCIWSKMKKIYIDSDGTIFPCCHIGNVMAGRPIEKSLYKKIIKDWKNINLYFNKFEDIIAGPFYKKYFLDSLKNSPHPVCITVCDSHNKKILNKEDGFLKYRI